RFTALGGLVLLPAQHGGHADHDKDGAAHEPGAPALPPRLQLVLADGIIDFLKSRLVGHAGLLKTKKNQRLWRRFIAPYWGFGKPSGLCNNSPQSHEPSVPCGRPKGPAPDRFFRPARTFPAAESLQPPGRFGRMARLRH